MRPIEHIRRNVLSMTQSQLAELTRVSQATVSRWERGELEPSRAEMEIIRQAGLARKGRRWSDRWFFEIPVARAGRAA